MGHPLEDHLLNVFTFVTVYCRLGNSNYALFENDPVTKDIVCCLEGIIDGEVSNATFKLLIFTVTIYCQSQRSFQVYLHVILPVLS